MHLTEQQAVDDLQRFPPAETCRLIPFESARILRPSKKIIFLIVQGEKPYINMGVSLSPWIYVTQPDYWRYDVHGCIGGILLPETAPYVAFADATFMHGTKGIEVVGFDSFQQIDL
ncbi:MAG TPA: hypothetical protein VF704_11130 [Allosphingosinicella sp.]|jgi:hypothetical protein